jgi:hypothetical protein
MEAVAVDAQLAAKKEARRRKKAAKRGVTTRHNVAIFETIGEMAAAKGLWEQRVEDLDEEQRCLKLVGRTSPGQIITRSWHYWHSRGLLRLAVMIAILPKPQNRFSNIALFTPCRFFTRGFAPFISSSADNGRSASPAQPRTTCICGSELCING